MAWRNGWNAARWSGADRQAVIHPAASPVSPLPPASFHIVVVGIAVAKFSRLLMHVRSEYGYRISHIVTNRGAVERLVAEGFARSEIHLIDTAAVPPRPSADDVAYLADLDRAGVQTVHNMIMGDPYAKRLPYVEALAYGAHLGRSLGSLYEHLRPSVVLSSHDRMLASLTGAVAKFMDVPWFVMNYSVVPTGYVGVGRSVVPGQLVPLRGRSTFVSPEAASRLLEDFENRRLRAPAYVSSHTLGLVLRRLGRHASAMRQLLKAHVRGSFDKYNQASALELGRQYLRKRVNMLRFPHHWFVDAPPADPFILFGFHMQPESSVDVYSPFQANQFDVVEKLARAIPPTHKLLVKVHISDADNYSRRQLRRVRQLPGVLLVAPTAWSRPFIEQCAAVATISGTMGLEGALLGKPVLVFGSINYTTFFPTVTQVGDYKALPELLARQLRVPHPGRAAIVAAYADFLNHYVCATGPQTKYQLDEWLHPEPSPEERTGFLEIFRSLHTHLQT